VTSRGRRWQLPDRQLASCTATVLLRKSWRAAKCWERLT